MDVRLPKAVTRIQEEKRERILEAALELFSAQGFSGASLDRIAAAADMSKPNLLYYFRGKDDIYAALVARLLDRWLEPLRGLDAAGDPLDEIRAYIRRKLEMSRDFPRESRLFAGEILAGAPRILPLLEGELRHLVDDKAALLERWMAQGRLRACDPRHLIFSVWATTQHYADFDAQVRAVMGPEENGPARFEAAAEFLEDLFVSSLRPGC